MDKIRTKETSRGKRRRRRRRKEEKKQHQVPADDVVQLNKVGGVNSCDLLNHLPAVKTNIYIKSIMSVMEEGDCMCMHACVHASV